MISRISYYLSLTITLSALSSCVRHAAQTKEFEKIFDYETSHAQQNGLILHEMYGIARENIENFILVLESHKKLTVEDSRELVVNEIEELLNFINTNKEWPSPSGEQPIVVNNFDLGIEFTDESTGEILGPPYIGEVILTHGIIHYDHYYKQREKCDRFQRVQKENYEKALGIIKSKQENLL